MKKLSKTEKTAVKKDFNKSEPTFSAWERSAQKAWANAVIKSLNIQPNELQNTKSSSQR